MSNDNKYLKLKILTEFVQLYFISRKIENFGFCRYGIFKRLIKYALDTTDYTLVRRGFDSLRRSLIMKEIVICSTKHYLFNPYERPYRMRANGQVDWLDLTTFPTPTDIAWK